MRKIFILFFSFIIASNLKAQCTAPSFTVDLRASIDTTAIISNQTRAGVCCGSSNCVTFLVYSNINSDLISFDVTNPSPSGSAYYQVNCGTPVSIGTPLCIKGLASPFTITYCKPGGDAPNYVLSAGKTVHGSEDISIQKTGCKDTLFVTNVNVSTINWTSIYPGVQGAYNSYLSCTSGCNSTIVTPGANPPLYIDFKVSGSPNVTCGAFTSDTIRVYFVGVLTGTITPLNPVICSTSGSTLVLTANVSAGAMPYKYDWNNVPGTNNSYTTSVSSAGTYSVIITDQTKCPSITLTKVISTIPVTSFSYSASNFCKNDANPSPIFTSSGQAGVFSATPAGLVFLNSNTGVINLAACNPGTYVVTNTVSPSGSCSGSSATSTITINPFPIMTSAATATICSENAVNIGLTSSSSSNFTWIASDNVNTTGESLTSQTNSNLSNTLVNLGTGNQTVIYTVTPTSNLAGGCVGNSQVVNVTVRPKDDASFNYPSSTNCQTGFNPVATISGLSGGIFSAGAGLVFSNSVGNIDLSASAIGSYTVTYSVSAVCPNSNTFPINITTAPMADFSFANSPYCQNAANPFPTFSNGSSAGTFSSSSGLVFMNNLTGEIDLTSSAAGTYTVTNTISPSGLCGTSAATAVVTITQLKEAGFIYTASPICQNSSNPLPAFILNGEPGTFTSTSGLDLNSSTGSINLSGSVAGTYTVTNTIPAIAGCPIIISENNITITSLPIADFSYSASPYCSTSPNQSPTYASGGTAGLFNASSVYLNIDPSTGLINIVSSTAGDYVIQNTIAAAGGCPAVVASTSVTITKLPDATITYAGPYCSNSANPTPVLSVDGTNGNYTSNPTGLTLESTAGTIDISSSTAGTYTVTNTISAANGCPVVTAENIVTITSLPIAAFSYSSSPFCSTSSNQLPTLATGATAGNFNASSVSLDIDPSTGLLNIVNSTAGDYVIVNTISATGGCPIVVSNASVTITKLPNATISYNGPYCSNSSNPTPVLSVDGTNGNYTSNPTGLNLDATAGTIDIASSAAGTYTVTNTISASDGCPEVNASSSVTITKLPEATFNYSSGSYCIDGSNPSPSFQGAGTAGTFSANPALLMNTSNGQVDLTGCVVGTYSITNTILAANGCPDVSADGVITINPIATVNAGIDAAICADESYTLSGAIGGSASGLLWTSNGSGIFSNPNSATSLYTPSVSDINMGTVVLTITSDDPAGPCSFATDFMTLTIKATPTVSAGSTNTLTCSNTTLSLGGSGDGTYAWQGPGIVSGATSANPTINQPGTYSLVVTSSQSCSSEVSTVVISKDTIAPIITSANTGSLNCTTLSANASVTTISSPVSYNWSGAGITSSTNINTISITQGGIFYYAVTNTFNNCVTTGSLSVLQDTIAPTVMIAVPSITTTCSNPTTLLNIGCSPATDVVYAWSAPSTGSLDSYTSLNPTASGCGVFTVVVTNTLSGCVSTSLAQSSIEVIADIGIPTTTLSMTSVDITCANPNPSVTLSSNTSNVTYSWAPVNGIVSGTENTASPSFSVAGTYSAVVTNTNSGCSTFINNNVVTAVLNNSIPVVSLTGSVNNGTINCSTATVVATSSVTPGNDLSYTWTSPNGTGISGPSNQASATFTSSGIYTLAVTNTVTGCLSVLDANSLFTVFVDTISPVANFKFVTGCSKDSVKFIDQSSISAGNITDWTWNFGDGNNSLLQNPANIYSQVDSYSVSLLVRAANGCASAANGTVSLIPPVVADFVPGGGEYLINQPIVFTNQSSGASNYIWNFGDLTTTSSSNPTHAFTSLGSYDVMLVSSNSIGCKDSISFVLKINPAGYAIPGAFTPNGDGVNDGFSVLGGPFISYELRVYNAWGNEIFIANSQNDKWDGSYRDTQQPAGTYIYIFNGKIADGDDLKLKGEVHIIR
ncbi:MAG: PKD domain-containing protein [Bacteroidota bacterium]